MDTSRYRVGLEIVTGVGHGQTHRIKFWPLRQSLESEWPETGLPLVGARPGSWRSSRVGAGAPPIRTSIGWLLPFHGATAIEEGNVYSMGWCVLDLKRPETVLCVSDTPPLTPEAPYEIEHGEIPQVDPAIFKTGIRVVFPQGPVERGDDLLVYYGATDVSVAPRAFGNATSLRRSPRQSN